MTEQLTPQQELDGYRSQRIAGTMTQADYLAHVDRLAPHVESGTPAAASAQVDAHRQLAELRQKRVDGTITEREFFAEADKLGPVAHPEPSAVVDDTFTAPESPAAYHFDYRGNSPSSDEDRATDTAIRQTLHDAGVPQRIAGYAYDTVERLSAKFEGADDATIKGHVDNVAAQLRQRWGASFDAKIDAIDELVTSLPGQLGEVLSAAPHLLADALLLTQLADFIEHRRGTAR